MRICASDTRNGHCVLFLALALESIEPRSTRVNITSLNVNCNSKDRKNSDWADINCEVIPKATTIDRTFCKCDHLSKSFDLSTDIFSPPRVIDFDQIFVNGCENCAYTVIGFSVVLIAIWLGTLVWSSVSFI